jgi:hypothetical protein
MDNYGTQYGRVKRALARVEDQNRDQQAYEDDLWTFFMHAWHLKDWVKHDTAVPQAVRDSIENDVKQHRALMVAADLANGAKHLTLTSKRVGAVPSGKDVSVYLQGALRLGSSGEPPLPPPPPQFSYRYRLKLDNGSELNALDVARDAVAAWKTILTSNGLL